MYDRFPAVFYHRRAETGKDNDIEGIRMVREGASSSMAVAEDRTGGI